MPEYTVKHQQLLFDLKNTVESLLVTQVANVWSIYGGLSRLHNSLEKIFKHGVKSQEEDGDYLNFIQGLEWLQPEHSKSYFSVDCEYESYIPHHLKNDKSSIWLYRSIENHSLSQKLSWLLSDKTHLLACYQSYAFLCQDSYAEATIVCLRAIEHNQVSLISEINPNLFVIKSPGREYHKVHRRCSSFPDNHSKIIWDNKKRSKSFDFNKSNKKVIKESVLGKLKPWNSLPLLINDNIKLKDLYRVNSVSKTTPSTPVHTKKISPSMIKVDYSILQAKAKKPIKRPLKKIKHVLINNQDIIEHKQTLSSSQSSGNVDITLKEKSPVHLATSPLSIVDGFLPLAGEKDYRKKPKKSFIEDGGMSVLPMATGFFPRPTKGQTLTSFLTSSQFSRANAELDRENAHFKISEAIISAMEQIKCKKDLKLVDENEMDDSDPEIFDLKQRIRLRRRQKMVEKSRFVPGSVLSDGRTDTTTSVSPNSTTPDSLSDYSSSDDVDDYEIDQASNLIENSGLSMSMASLYSEADLSKRPRGAPDGASDVLSAEGVALSLISKFSAKQLPRASELEWLVSEQDAPQALLPMPKSWPISPDDGPQSSSTTPLRGTQEWAPPRPQIIFTKHTAPSRKDLMHKQNYRCAGCSMKVAPQYASRFRYCDYLGRYFCTQCHTNQLALIPGRILQKWDFTRYPVSTFSYRLLEQMFADPLFRIFELNKNILKLSKNLQICRKLRLGLFYLKDFVFTCKYAETIQERFEQELKFYLLNDPEVYSIEDLVHIKSGELKNKLKLLVELCCRHTSECKICTARGFICEICNSEEIIFPWQMRIVRRCSKCGSCYHSKCWKAEVDCLKCERITKRKQSLDSRS
ncbi:unnamed protein product [Brassicogethes aeneus]|uniref:RUN domain-containing protein n=1 Tax=Brassicogethes aeneus TaxID=1431903 RepID=A0A9P0FHZ3_BRAAE|nr:unnamed protein product [Brassicogethes aeneus]